MKKTTQTLQINSLKRIFQVLKDTYSEQGKEAKDIITSMDKYSVIELIIPGGPKAYGCAAGFRNKSHGDGQVLKLWGSTPMGTEDNDEINVFDPSPFLTLETFKEDLKKDFHELKLEYKVGTVTSGALAPLVKILEQSKQQYRTHFLNKSLLNSLSLN